MTQFNGRLKFAVISKIDFSWLKIVHILENLFQKYIYLFKGFGFKNPVVRVCSFHVN